MSDTQTDTGLWAGIFARLNTSLDGVGKALRRRNTLDLFQREIPLRIPASIPAVTGTVNVYTPSIWTPPEGYWWRVRAMRVLGPKAANGTELAITGVNVDMYVTGPGAPGNVVPPSGDWVGSSGTSSAPGAIPVTFAPSAKETLLQVGDQLVIVMSGANVANTAFVASLQVTQYQGLSSFSGSEEGD